MNAAPCSCRVVTCLIRVSSARASRMSIVSSPGTEKTHSQPSAARQSTRRRAAVGRGSDVIGPVYGPILRAASAVTRQRERERDMIQRLLAAGIGGLATFIFL